MNFIIETERLLLRPFQKADAPALRTIAGQPEVLRWMPDWAFFLDKSEQLIEYFGKRGVESTKEDCKVVFAVTLKEGPLIGMTGLGTKEEVDGEMEVAYFISADHAGKGYISEAAKAVTQWAFENLLPEYLIAIVEPDNQPSLQVVKHCGFQKVDTRKILNSGDTEEKWFHYFRLYPHSQIGRVN